MPFALPQLTATRWIDFKGSGRTRPALIACELPEGGEVECVVKLGGHRESAPHQPVCELVAALLAVDLGLPVAEPVLVEITPEFTQLAVPAGNAEARARCGAAPGWAFATRHLAGGFAGIPVGKPPPQILLPTLAELYAFDGLIQNADRIPLNSNCLLKGSDLRFFDHDQAFGFLLDLFGSGPIEQPATYRFLTSHLARPFLPVNRAQFSRLEGSWKAITPELVASYRAAVPEEWPGKASYLPRIEDHLGAVHAKLATALDAITFTLSTP